MTLSLPDLHGRFVHLTPLDESHREALREACNADPNVWEALYPYPMNGVHLDHWWTGMEAERKAGTKLAMAGLAGGQVVGLSCFMIDAANRRVEIGNTYWRPEARGGAINPEAKMLMLTKAFDGELMGQPANVVQFKVDAINDRSRTAVAKLGAHLDGVIRHDRIVWTGRVRDTCVFSILAEEWPMVRDKLEARLMALSER